MGRHRTSRAKQKLIKDPKRKLSNKRNRDLKLKSRRKAYQKSVSQRAKINEAYMKNAYPQLQPKPSDMERVAKKISSKFLERVEAAQSTYDDLINIADHADAIIEVLDARDPFSFRFLDIEGEAASQQKPLMFVINKIDLVPASVVKKWIAFLSQTAPTVAISAKNDRGTSSQLVMSTLEKHMAQCQNVAVVGATGVGKTALCDLMGGKLVDTGKWLWTLCGNSLGLTNSVPWKGRIREFLVDTFERITNDVIFSLMEVTKDESIGNTLVAFARKNGITKQEAPEIIMNKLINWEWKWTALPPETTDEFNVEDPLQIKAFEQCCKDDESTYILLGEGKTVQMDRKALEFQIPEPGSSDEQSEDDEEEEEEDKE